MALQIFSEKPAWSVDGMRATNFITGAGGLLQSIMFGYLSVRARAHQLDLLTPYKLPYTDSWKVIGFDYRGFTMDFRIEESHIYVKLTGKTNSEDLLMARHGDKVIRHMVVGQEYSYTPQKVAFVVESERSDAELPPGLVEPCDPDACAATTFTGSILLCSLFVILAIF